MICEIIRKAIGNLKKTVTILYLKQSLFEETFCLRFLSPLLFSVRLSPDLLQPFSSAAEMMNVLASLLNSFWISSRSEAGSLENGFSLADSPAGKGFSYSPERIVLHFFSICHSPAFSGLSFVSPTYYLDFFGWIFFKIK